MSAYVVSVHDADRCMGCIMPLDLLQLRRQLLDGRNVLA